MSLLKTSGVSFLSRQPLSPSQLAVSMKDSFFLLISLFLLVQRMNGSPTPYAYWAAVFPNTSMPDAVRALLPLQTLSDKRGYSGSTVNTDVRGTFNPSQVYSPYYMVWVDVERDDVQQKPSFTRDESNNTDLFFLEGNLKPGRIMNLTMLSTAKQGDNVGPSFLPREESDVMPFSTTKLATILRMWSVKPDSQCAFLIRQTLLDCERPPIKGEIKHCASSLEDMVSFVLSLLGTSDVNVLSYSLGNKEDRLQAGEHKVQVAEVKMKSSKTVTCHNMVYPYAVFYCHMLPDTQSFVASLIADDGGRMNAVALCHRDTTNWNPGHVSFRILGVEPGTVPVCHFLQEGFVWVPN